MTENADRRLYATWRHPGGLIRPVGVLTRHASDQPDGEATFRFVYLKATEQFDGFRPLPGLPDLHRVYESEQLFPVFRNRQMRRRRPDYEDYVRELDLDVSTDPFEVLARSEGWRATDRIEVFAYPGPHIKTENLKALFFARGIRHLPGAADAVVQGSAGRPPGPWWIRHRQRGELAGRAHEQSDRTRASDGCRTIWST